jgi:hypothetical protein
VPEEEIVDPVPFGVRDDGYVLDDLAPEAIADSPVWPLDKSIMSEKANGRKQHFGVDEKETDPNDLHQTGWAVIFAPGVSSAIKAALQPLLDHRKSIVNDDRLFQIFDGDYKKGEKAKAWLDRHHVSMRTVVPLKGIPYYVLIVASPSDIPFDFQYELDIFWAVGRIWFDTAAEFAQYAKSVIEYETMKSVPTSRQVALFATRNENDKATNLLMNKVVLPLVNGTSITKPIGQTNRQNFNFQVFSKFLGDYATKPALNSIFQGDIPNGPPAILFTGSHGKSVSDPANAQLPDLMGAPICQEWVRGAGPSKPDQYFAGADLPSDAKVHGMIHFMFACYGAGWPKVDTYSRTQRKPTPVSPEPMMARLPSKLLAHPGGGALAVLGHIDRAWSWSFQSDDGTAQTGDFRMILNALMSGDRIGQATDRFNGNWGALSVGIADLLQQIKTKSRKLSPEKLKQLKNQWIARDDARNYVVFGDPAVRLRVDNRYTPAQLEPMPVIPDPSGATPANAPV